MYLFSSSSSPLLLSDKRLGCRTTRAGRIFPSPRKKERKKKISSILLLPLLKKIIILDACTRYCFKKYCTRASRRKNLPSALPAYLLTVHSLFSSVTVHNASAARLRAFSLGKFKDPPLTTPRSRRFSFAQLSATRYRGYFLRGWETHTRGVDEKSIAFFGVCEKRWENNF